MACEDKDHYSRLLEIKSMGSKSYRMLAREGLEKSYIVQVSSYLRATKLPEAVVVCKNKDTSDLAELVVKEDKAAVDAALIKIDAVIDSKVPEDVIYNYGPNDEGKLSWVCAYCPYIKQCWKDYEPIEYDERKWRLNGDYKNLPEIPKI